MRQTLVAVAPIVQFVFVFVFFFFFFLSLSGFISNISSFVSGSDSLQDYSSSQGLSGNGISVSGLYFLHCPQYCKPSKC